MPGQKAHDRFQIPDVIDPPKTVCFTMTIPDDPIHIANFLGAVYQICFGPNYQDDSAHSAKELVQVWRRYFNTIKIDNCGALVPSAFGGLLEDFEMPLRVDCDCNVFITCCDGTEKQLLTKDQVEALLKAQPGPNNSQPGPGHCTSYPFVVIPGASYLIGALVNTGDLLTIDTLDGASTEASPIGRWNCPSGLQFIGGFCTGSPLVLGTTLLPSAPVGVPLYYVNGTYFDARTPFTVPSGIVNLPIAIVLNDTPGGAFAGSVTGNVQVCNNQTPSACETLDFAITTQGFEVPTGDTGDPLAIWTPGTGFTSADAREDSSNFQRTVNVFKNLPSIPVARIDFQYDLTKGTYHDPTDLAALILVNGTPVATLNHSAAVDGAGQHFVWTGAVTATQIDIILASSIEDHAAYDGACKIVNVEICYTGTVAP